MNGVRGGGGRRRRRLTVEEASLRLQLLDRLGGQLDIFVALTLLAYLAFSVVVLVALIILTSLTRSRRRSRPRHIDGSGNALHGGSEEIRDKRQKETHRDLRAESPRQLAMQ